MQVAQLSNVKADSNYPELVTHLQYPQVLQLDFFFLKAVKWLLFGI